MDFKALKDKYRQLLFENNRLKEETKRLRTQLGMDTINEESKGSANNISEFLDAPEPELFARHIKPKPSASSGAIDKLSDASVKIRLFQSLFKGSDDVYAKRWEKMLEKMYNKRLAGYSSIGYKAKGENIAAESTDIIFDKSNFLPVYSNDIVNATREILIVSPFVTKRRTLQMIQNLRIALKNGVHVVVVTRPSEDFKEKDLTYWQTAIDLIKSSGIAVVFKSNIHQKVAVIDQKVFCTGASTC